MGRAKKRTQEWDSSRTKPDVARARQGLVCWIIFLVIFVSVLTARLHISDAVSVIVVFVFFLFDLLVFFF